MNSRLLTALRSRNMLTRTAALAAACIVSTGAAGAQSPAAPGSAGIHGALSRRLYAVGSALRRAEMLSRADCAALCAASVLYLSLFRQLEDLPSMIGRVARGRSSPMAGRAPRSQPSSSERQVPKFHTRAQATLVPGRANVYAGGRMNVVGGGQKWQSPVVS